MRKKTKLKSGSSCNWRTCNLDESCALKSKKVKLKFDTWNIVTRALEEGVLIGYRHAHKHTDKPDQEVLISCIYEAVLDELCEVLKFE